MNKLKFILLSGFFVVGVIGMLFVYSRHATHPAQHLISSQRIFEYSIDIIKGTSTPRGPGWNLYINRSLRFEIAYPTRHFAYGVLKIQEKKNIKPKYDPYAAGDPFYEILFSDGDSSFYVTLTPSRYPTIDNWITYEGQEYLSSSYEIRERKVGNEKALLIRHLPIIKNPHEEDIREQLVFIQNDILYTIDLNFLKNTERKQIFESFKTL